MASRECCRGPVGGDDATFGWCPVMGHTWCPTPNDKPPPPSSPSLAAPLLATAPKTPKIVHTRPGTTVTLRGRGRGRSLYYLRRDELAYLWRILRSGLPSMVARCCTGARGRVCEGARETGSERVKGQWRARDARHRREVDRGVGLVGMLRRTCTEQYQGGEGLNSLPVLVSSDVPGAGPALG